MVVYEPSMSKPEFFGSRVTHDLESFKRECDVIIANRCTEEISNAREKVFTRNLFGANRDICHRGAPRPAASIDGKANVDQDSGNMILDNIMRSAE